MKKVATYFVYMFAAIGLFLTGGFFAVKLGITNEKGIIDEQRNSFMKKQASAAVPADQKPEPAWSKSAEWEVLKEAVLRDKEAIDRAAALAGIEPRMVVSLLIVEQLRLFHDNRELFKTVFAPLKVLGNQSQFSWGVMGIKQETAVETENSLQNPSSPFYPGKDYEHLLDFKTSEPDKERFERIVDEHDRFYSYLYAAVIVKELETQWKNAGYSLSGKPDIVATLYNIGFKYSKPHPSPQSGGASIRIGSHEYSFGSLSADFYHSQELIEAFPRSSQQ